MMLERGAKLKPADLDITIPGVAFLKDEKLFYEPHLKRVILTRSLVLIYPED